jgi:flagellin-like hook-associated protein FlgL
MMAANTARNLSATYGKLGKSVERLSTGLRINSAADDAAGLAIREMMRTDIATLRQGVRNAADAISMIQTADGALAVIDEKLTRMKELAEQAATGTYTTVQREIINSEYQAMAAEIDRIANATNFNGIKLLDGSVTNQHGGRGIKIHFGTSNNAAEDYYFVNIGDARATSSSGLRVGGDAKNDIWAQGAAASGALAGPGCCTAGFTSLKGLGGFTSGETFSYGYNWDWTEDDDPDLLSGKYLAGRYTVNSSDSLQDLVNKVNAGTQSRVGIQIDNTMLERAIENGSGTVAICIGNEAYYWGSAAVAGGAMIDKYETVYNYTSSNMFVGGGLYSDEGRLAIALGLDRLSVNVSKDGQASAAIGLNAIQNAISRQGLDTLDTSAQNLNNAIGTLASIIEQGGYQQGDLLKTGIWTNGQYWTTDPEVIRQARDAGGWTEIKFIVGDEMIDSGSATVTANILKAEISDQIPGAGGAYANITQKIDRVPGFAMPAMSAGSITDFTRAYQEWEGGIVDESKDLFNVSSAGADKFTAASLASAINHNVNSNYWAMTAGDDEDMIYVFRKDGGDNNAITACEVGGRDPVSRGGLHAVNFENLETGKWFTSGTNLSLGGEDWAKMLPVQTKTDKGNEVWNVTLNGRDVGKERDLWIANSGDLTTPGLTDGIINGLDRDAFLEIQNAADANWKGAEIRTQSSAQESLDAITDAITRKDKIRANLGAMQNRLENTMTNLEIQAENLQASESRISDVDVAKEMTEFTKNNVLVQAGVSMLAQANSMSQMALSLLG